MPAPQRPGRTARLGERTVEGNSRERPVLDAADAMKSAEVDDVLEWGLGPRRSTGLR
jgi:hypothetical protein